MREIRFLEVVIGPDEIKIEEEKMKEVLDWPIFQGVKNIQKFLGYQTWFILEGEGLCVWLGDA